MNVIEVMKEASVLGACKKSEGVSNWKSLTWLFFSPQGREFCEKHNFPTLEMFQEMDNIEKYGVFVDAGSITCDECSDIALIGNTYANISCYGTDYVHKIILMHGAKAKIKASGYAVILIVNIGGEVEIEKDETVIIL